MTYTPSAFRSAALAVAVTAGGSIDERTAGMVKQDGFVPLCAMVLSRRAAAAGRMSEEGRMALSTMWGLALQSAGMPVTDSRLARGLAWLRSHQDPKTGEWHASSLNKQRESSADAAKFMSDATASAVLSLTYADSLAGVRRAE